MKFYYPTTTLNFDSILSSQMISPPGLYKPGTLWWNRHEAILGERPDTIVLYNKCPVWNIDDPERDNYPLVIELDKSFAKSDKVECVIDKTLKATCLFATITFSMLEIMQGKVRFLFRNKTELERMLTRAITGVGECKVANAIKIEHPETFDLMPTARTKVFKLDAVLPDVGQVLKDRPLNGEMEYSEDEIRGERERGAELGYQAGRNARFVRTGLFLDGYRVPITYDDWKKKILPEPFSALIDKLCVRPLKLWDPNRVAVAQFCKECWFDCFLGKKVDGKSIVEGTKIHTSLQMLARHWLSPEESYRISAEHNPYMQAFAAFLECGNNAGKYPRFAKENLLKQPEYLLCLYGALVGYTSFSRILLDNKAYLPQPPQKTEEEQKDKRHPYCGDGVSVSQRVMTKLETASSAPIPEDVVAAAPKESFVGKLKSVFTGGLKGRGTVQPSLFDQPQRSLVVDQSLLVCDGALCSDVADHFAAMGDIRVRELTQAIQWFCEAYTDGYYGRNPDKYKQTNPDLIDHLLRCFKSEKTPVANFSWQGEGEERDFVVFLEKRYSCCRKSHGV